MGSGSSTHKQKLESLSNTSFFLALETDKLVAFADYFEVVNIKAGDTIPSNEYKFIIVAKGELSISMVVQAHTNQKQKIAELLCTKKVGDFFSRASHELANPNPGNGRGKLSDSLDLTTVKALTETQILGLKQHGLTDYLAKNDTDKAILQKVLNTDVVSQLSQIPFLKDVERRKLVAMSELFSYQTFNKGDVIFYEGDVGSKFYMVLAGELEVTATASKDGKAMGSYSPRTRSSSTGIAIEEGADTGGSAGEVEEGGAAAAAAVQGIRVGGVKGGEYFGEMALMVDMPRSATVTATEKCLVLTLEKVYFKNFIKLDGNVAISLDIYARTRMMQMLFAYRIPFFQGIEPERLVEMAKICKLCQYTAGSSIIAEGGTGDSFYICFYGDLEITTKKGLSSGQDPILLGQGNYFGEISLVTDQPHKATVTAATDVVLLAITMEGFTRFFAESPQYLVEFEMRILGERTDLAHVLNHPMGREMLGQYLEKEFSRENLRFWVAIEDKFHSCANSEDRKKLADSICDEFVKDTAATLINVPHEMRIEVLTNVENGHFGNDLFDRCQAEIFHLMDGDSFARFKHTENWKNLMVDIGCYQGLEVEVNKSPVNASAMLNKRLESFLVTAHDIDDELRLKVELMQRKVSRTLDGDNLDGIGALVEDGHGEREAEDS